MDKNKRGKSKEASTPPREARETRKMKKNTKQIPTSSKQRLLLVERESNNGNVLKKRMTTPLVLGIQYHY